jgi:hypothetical protein
MVACEFMNSQALKNDSDAYCLIFIDNTTLQMNELLQSLVITELNDENNNYTSYPCKWNAA